MLNGGKWGISIILLMLLGRTKDKDRWTREMGLILDGWIRLALQIIRTDESHPSSVLCEVLLKSTEPLTLLPF